MELALAASVALSLLIGVPHWLSGLDLSVWRAPHGAERWLASVSAGSSVNLKLVRRCELACLMRHREASSTALANYSSRYCLHWLI